jgi:hypothetical protein
MVVVDSFIGLTGVADHLMLEGDTARSHAIGKLETVKHSEVVDRPQLRIPSNLQPTIIGQKRRDINDLGRLLTLRGLLATTTQFDTSCNAEDPHDNACPDRSTSYTLHAAYPF